MTSNDNFFQLSSFYIRGPLTMTVFILGVFFNAIAVYYLILAASNKRMFKVKTEKVFKNIAENAVTPLVSPSIRSTFHPQVIQPRIYVYFLWLTACDIALLFSALFTYSLPTMFFGFSGPYVHIIPIWYTCSNATFTASVWLVLALMLERYNTLGRNFKKVVTARASSQSRTQIHKKLFILSTLAFLYALPRYFEISVTYNEKLATDILIKTALIQNQIYILVYRIIGSLLFYSAVPYVIALILSLKICSVIKKSYDSFSRSNVANSDSPKKLRDSEKFLLVLCFRFLFSRSMTTIIDISEHVIGSEKFLGSSVSLFFIDLSNFIVILTSVTNFFILLAFSKTFRGDILYFLRISRDKECENI